MAMRKFAWTALAAGLLALAGAGGAWAQDTLRLVIPTSTAVSAGSIDGGTNTELVYHRGGHYHGGFYRGGYGYGGYRGYGYGGYYRPSYYGGYYGGYRGYGYGGFYRPFYYGGYYARPYYYGSYYYPSYYSAYYYPSYYSAYYPCATTVANSTPLATVYSSGSYATPQVTQPGPALLPQPQAVPQMPPPANGNQTFPYDGGPRAPLPMPGLDANPTGGPGTPRPTVPLEGKFVSLPQETTGGIGLIDTASLSTVSWRPVSTSQPATSPTTRYHYPAYGEQSLPPVNRTRK